MLMKVELERLQKKLEKYEKVVIVGAGENGKELYNAINRDINVAFFFDNYCNKIDNCDIRVVKPFLIDEKILYIISVSEKNRELLLNQLLELGIQKIDIFILYSFFDYDYVKNLDACDYPKIIREQYKYYMKKDIDLDKPITYNEIINWEKINVNDPLRTMLADKVAVRQWVGEKIGIQYLNEVYGVWNSENEIEFGKLPDQFVLKVNNGSNRNIIVKDKNNLNIREAKSRIKFWLEHNYAYNDMEMHYKDIVPKVFAEKYLEGVADSVYEYDVFCFNGTPMYIWCIKGSHLPHCKASFYDLEWNKQSFSYGYPIDDDYAPKPIQLDSMIEKTAVLAKGFKHIRVDWFLLPTGEMYFGEMTFSTWGGYLPFSSEDMDVKFGQLINGEAN